MKNKAHTRNDGEENAADSPPADTEGHHADHAAAAAPSDAPGAPTGHPAPSHDPFDPKHLTLGQDFAAEIGVQKLTTMVPVRKPHRHEWVRAHSSPDYCLQTAALTVKFEREEIYLVAQPLWSQLPSEVRPIALFVAINREGVVFIWPVKLPGPDGRQNPWFASALEAVEYAKTQWVRVGANMPLGAYEIYTAAGVLADPTWPPLTLQQLLKIAFRDRYIESLDHPVLKRLRGES